MLNIVVNSKDVMDFTRQLSISGTKMEQITEEAAPQVGEAVSRVILSAIKSGYEKRSMGEFMFARTKIDMEFSGGTVVLHIHGATEGELGEVAADTRSGGPVYSATNLWARHEFGASYDPVSGQLSYTKDIGGITVVRDGKEAAASSPHAGQIKKIVSGLRFEMQKAVEALFMISADVAVSDAVEHASNNKIHIDKSASAVFRRAKISKELLSSLGVVDVHVKNGGQIMLLGRGAFGAATIIGGKAHGIPTTINR